MKVKTPKETYLDARTIGDVKVTLGRTSLPRMAVMATAAGAYISLGALLSVVVGFGMPEAAAANPSLQRLLSALTFPIGLVLIVVLGGELFTGNNALLVPGLVERRFGWRDVALNWTMVWIFNFVGALLFIAVFVAGADMLTVEPWKSAIVKIAEAKANSMTWWTVFFKAVGANWCVCLAVWLALSGKTLGEKILACWIPVGAFVALGFEHCIANMFFIPAGMFGGAEVTMKALFVDNLLPATLGNIVGGAILVGTLHSWLHRDRTNK